MAKKSLISRRSFLKKTALLNMALILDACGGGTIDTGSSGSSNTGTPSSLSYSLNPATYTINTAIASNTPSHSGGKPSSYSVSPSLPAGLSLNKTTGVISGTPTAVTTNANYVVTATNSAGSTTATISITVNNVASYNTLYDGVIQVGTGTTNRFVNGAGEVIQLRGANMSGLETTAMHQWSPGDPWGDDGGTPRWDIYATWKPNIVRLPLCAASWLGLTVADTKGAEGSPAWDTDYSADPGSNYQATVIAAVAAAQAIGCYVIIDLHWCAPKFTLGGVTKYLAPQGQSAFADYDTAIPFWQSIANMFGTQAMPQSGVNNNAIMFELFNEPYMNQNGYTMTTAKGGGTSLSADKCIGQGGWSDQFINQSQNGTNFVLAQDWRVAGHQEMLDTIRATGAQNVCIVNGNYWAQDLSGYTTYTPTDSLNQIAYGWHPYPLYGVAYAASLYKYASCGAYDAGYGNANCFDPAVTIMAAGYPVICTEDGGRGGTSATNGEPHMAYVQSWADTSGASYIFWQWNNTQPYGTASDDNYLTVYASDGKTILPVQGSGQTTYNWMSNHA